MSIAKCAVSVTPNRAKTLDCAGDGLGGRAASKRGAAGEALGRPNTRGLADYGGSPGNLVTLIDLIHSDYAI